MILARVVGTVVATRKDERLVASKLLVARPLDVSGQPDGNYLVAVDTVDAGLGDTVLIVSVILLGFIGMAILFLLRLKPKGVSGTDLQDTASARPLSEIISQPRFIVALTCAVGSYTLMSFVMTGAPLAMVGCGFTADQATLGISWHVMAMFAPSFFTGRLISHFGKERIVIFGLMLLLGCAAVALSGIALWQFWTALILLGLGWNFGFIGATAMVAVMPGNMPTSMPTTTPAPRQTITVGSNTAKTPS